jgi:CDP-diacylglycerol--glycerol-3-phosphate 3-phosphatidyltransferase
MKNIANKLTLFRILLAFIFVCFIYVQSWMANLIALLIFILAGVTDFLDGRLARRQMEITEFGKFIDPIADKILVFAALVSFVDLNLVPGWMVIAILTRDFLINGLRFLSAKKGIVLSSNQLAKHKTFSQMAAIFIILSGLIIKDISVNFSVFWKSHYSDYFSTVTFIIMLIVVIMSLFSGIMYMLSNRKIFLADNNV